MEQILRGWKSDQRLRGWKRDHRLNSKTTFSSKTFHRISVSIERTYHQNRTKEIWRCKRYQLFRTGRRSLEVHCFHEKHMSQ